MADHIERRRLVVGTQTAQMVLAFLLSALTLLHVVNVAEIFAVAFSSGLVNAINTPVRQGIISALVTKDELQNAIGINSAQFQTSRLIGPLLAGIIVARYGAGPASFTDGVDSLDYS